MQPAVENLIQACRDNIEQLLKQEQFTWDNFILPLTEMGDRFSKAWSPVSISMPSKTVLNSVQHIKRVCLCCRNTALG